MSEAAKKILVIEDDRETAGLIAEELAERGYEVRVAYDGREGFAAILKTMPDLVLSDIYTTGDADTFSFFICSERAPVGFNIATLFASLVPK